ncbi:MAG: DUF4232 domain-containing protein [Anaerolineaceae bacterium]|nr:DUF4232 domain-containing protein [Anaerolineaceae bacterium]
MCDKYVYGTLSSKLFLYPKPLRHILQLQLPILFFLLCCILVNACTPYPMAFSTADLNTPSPEGPASSPDDTLCDISALYPSATWQSAAGPVTGEIILTNFGSEACIIQGRPQIQIRDDSGRTLNIWDINQQNYEITPDIELQPESSVFATVVWKNWCRFSPDGSLRFRVSLPGYRGAQVIQMQDPNGRPLDDTPPCEDDSQLSSISIGILQPATP